MALIFGMAALGLLVGLFIAWSASPIAATALPLLFGLLGGAGGLSILRMDLSKENARRQLNILGLSIAAFSFACIFTQIIGLYFKPTLLAHLYEPKQAVVNEADKVETTLRKLLWKKRLDILGANSAEVQNVLSLLNEDKMKTKDIEEVEMEIDYFIEVLRGDTLEKKDKAIKEALDKIVYPENR